MQENNIYHKSDITDNTTPAVHITSDGIVDEIYNGVPDWVYEGQYYFKKYMKFPHQYVINLKKK